MPKTDAQYMEYFKSKCIVTDAGCWLWQGHVSMRKGAKDRSEGYAESSYLNRKVRLNRWMLTKTQRELKTHEFACHKCDNSTCINPDHLYIGTHQQNMNDMNGKGRNGYAKKTHCRHGHPYTPENTLVWNTGRGTGKGRACKTCQRIRLRIKAGWTREQAEAMPPTPPGHRPVGRSWPRGYSTATKEVK